MFEEKDLLKDISIDTLSYGGEGISKEDGRPHIFVPFSAPGDCADVQIDQVQKNFVHGRLVKLHKASEERQEPGCTYFSKCGGCHYQHIQYPAQLKYKHEQVTQSLKKFADLEDIQVTPLQHSAEWAYRNKVVFHVNKGQKLGFLNQEKKFLAIEHCPVASDPINSLIQTCTNVLKNHPNQDLLYISLRSSSTNNAIVFSFNQQSPLKGCIDWYEKFFSLPEETSIYFAQINPDKHHSPFSKNMIHIAGPETISELILNYELKIWPFLFWQNNPDVAQKMATSIVTWAKNNHIEKNIDLYCGSGFFSFALAQNKIYSLGAEINEDAVACAKENSLDLDLSQHSFFIHNDAADALKTISKNQEPFDSMTLDPPRKGLDKHFFKSLEDCPVAHIAYVSCNPITFARDAKKLIELGYHLDHVETFDMFPQTYHIELIGFFKKV